MTESYRQALSLYFHLLHKRIIPTTDDRFTSYTEEEVQQHLDVIAEEAGTRIVYGDSQIQLLAKGNGSTFASNFTHLRSRFPVENKSEFYLISVILVTYLAHAEQQNQFSTLSNGMTFFVLEEAVDQVMKTWKKQMDEDASFQEEAGVHMQHVVEKWNLLEMRNETKKKSQTLTRDRKSRLGFVTHAMSLLESEGLVFVQDKEREPKAIAKQALLDRMAHVYNHQDRFREIKQLIEASEGELSHA